ncbi:hypothetical protein [uncultured Massilia sp.]|uniref:hypothetical protein n=1 Tax=uncultured Massilia sp. TaxID=169973 RepID=UPI0025FD6C6A|nr:hypothetical protein [uncultured Massilia sp.]
MHEHPSFDVIKSIPQLLTERKTSAAAWAIFQAAATDIHTQESKTLVARIETTTDPLLLWQIHEELDRREVPPAFRWPVNQESTQIEYVTWLADIYWFTRRNPGHKPAYKNWQRWFAGVYETWHMSTVKAYLFAFKQGLGAAYFSKGLLLSDRDRQDLMTIKTAGQIARLHPLKRHAEYLKAILDHARAKPDRSGSKTPEEVAKRRYAMWKLYLLADGSETAAARQYGNLYGEQVARQNLGKQVALAREAWRAFGPAVKNQPLYCLTG